MEFILDALSVQTAKNQKHTSGPGAHQLLYVSEQEHEVFREVRMCPSLNIQGQQMLERWGRGEKEKRGETPQFCESQLLTDLLPASRMEDTYLGRSHCLLFPESFPMVPIRSNADVIWEETQARVSGNRRSKLLCRCS